jgi:putative glutamine amidotransferase
MNPIRILLPGRDRTNYIRAVEGVGGIAVEEWPCEIDASYDGLILCGGGDLHPSYYGEQIDGSRSIDDERDTLELALLKAYVDAGKPVMGICRGHQLINVFFGGSLWQDIPEAHLHTRIEGKDQVHGVVAAPDSILERYYGREFSVNSAHHQAIRTLGAGLRATAVWEGTHIEAVEHISLPVFGVQWHPERTCFENRRRDTVDGARLFEHFLSLCSQRREP